MGEQLINRATIVGADNVVSVWEAMNDGLPYFAVYYNKTNKWFQFNKEDIDAARNFLQSNLQAVQDTGDNAMYYLNIYSAPSQNFRNADMVGSFPFRLNAFNGAPASVGGVGDIGAFSKLINDAHAKQLELVKEIAELKAANAPLDWYDRITGILETPGAAQTIVPLVSPLLASIMGIVNKFTGITPANVPAMHTPGIAGPADNDQLLDQALDRLQVHGDLLEMLTALANFADKNPEQFKGYLTMLKSM